MSKTLQTAVARQRMLLSSRLSGPMNRLAMDCAAVWPHRIELERVLKKGLELLPYCKYLFILDDKARQITANLSHQGPLPENFGRDRSGRPYLAHAIAGERFSLSNAYISRNARRPSLTAVQHIFDDNDRLLGYLGVDFDLRELPLTREVYRQSEQWMQIKGDPAIRSGLFMQQRISSDMDERIDEVLDLIIELVEVHGVFHAKLQLACHVMVAGRPASLPHPRYRRPGRSGHLPRLDTARLSQRCRDSGGTRQGCFSYTA